MPKTLRDAACGLIASGGMAAATVMTGLRAAEAQHSPEHQLESDPMAYLSFVFGVFTVASTLLTERVVRDTYESERENLRERRTRELAAAAEAHDAVVIPTEDDISV